MHETEVHVLYFFLMVKLCMYTIYMSYNPSRPVDICVYAMYICLLISICEWEEARRGAGEAVSNGRLHSK